MKKVQVELVRSINGTPEWMRVIVRTLSLRKLRDKKIHPDNGAIRGMVNKVPHLVSIIEVKE
jgi:large subunit ribosomal protein L30